VAANLAEAFVNSAPAQHAAGGLFLRTEQPERALHFLQRAIALDGAPIEYRLSLAQAQFMLGRAGDSAATLEAIIAQHPGDSRARYWLDEVRRRAAPAEARRQND
jgi:predicted Zn-dependent protease